MSETPPAKFRVWLETDSGENATLEVVAQVTCEMADPIFKEQLSTFLFSQTEQFVRNSQINPLDIRGGGFKGRPAKSLYILAIDEPETAAAGLRVGAVVRSSMDLSRLLGYSYNMVTQVISRGKVERRKELTKMMPGEEKERKAASPMEFALRGVHFCFTDDLAREEV